MRRPRVGYGFKLGAGAVSLVMAVGAVVLVLVDHELSADLVGELDGRLEAQAAGAGAWAAEGRHPERLAVRLSGILGVDVTLLDGSGRVRGDSETEGMIGSDESSEPEVREAMAGRTGRASRASRLGVETRYVAVPVQNGNVLRLGSSLAPMHATISRLRLQLAVASGLGILLAAGLAYQGSRVAARPLLAMRDAARRIADGEYTVRLPGEAPDEFGELERSLSVLAERLAHDRSRIERLEAMRRDFVANVSHELRTPITAIQGYAETLLRGTADPETTRRFLETMHRQAQRVSQLVTDLLTLAEAEAEPPREPTTERVRALDVVRQAVASVCEKRTPSPVVRVDVPPDLVVKASAARLEQVVENLVENAVRYGGSKAVWVAAGEQDGSATLVVRDEGPGIAPEHLPRLFERFYRAGAPRERAHEGTGLGLAIVKHLTESMGGAVSVESEPGKGTAFTVRLALAREPGPDP
jgi:signal transduction histidine kinase